MEFELRFQKSELRAANDDQGLHVSGYVNKTNQLSEVLGSNREFVEKIAPGAFRMAIQNSTRDIDFLAEHNDKLILASTRNGSLVLNEDNVGLFMEATISDTSWGQDYYKLIKDGILRNMSFGFRTLKDDWKLRDDGLYERTIQELDLYEVSVVRDPAYTQSSISARGIDVIDDVEVPKELKKENRNMDEIKEALDKIEKRVKELSDKFEEFRSEEREKSKPETEVEEQPSEANQEGHPQEKAEEKEQKEPDQAPEVKDQKDEEQKDEHEEEHKEQDQDDEKDRDEEKESEYKEVQDEKSEDSEEEEKEEEDPKRSLNIMKEISELKDKLLELK